MSRIGVAAAIGAGVAIVGGVAAAVALHDRISLRADTESERSMAERSMARGTQRFDELVRGDGMLVADAAARLLRAHDVNRDGVLDETLDAARALSGRGEVTQEWKAWSQNVWPWVDPEAHLVQLIPNRAPRTEPVEVSDDSSWLRAIAGGDASVSRQELRSFVESFDRDGDDVLRGTELQALGDRIGETGYMTGYRHVSPVSGPFTPASEMASRLMADDVRAWLAGLRPDGAMLEATPVRHSSPTLWDVRRSPNDAERAAGQHRSIDVASDLTAEQVQALFVEDGVASVFHAPNGANFVP